VMTKKLGFLMAALAAVGGLVVAAGTASTARADGTVPYTGQGTTVTGGVRVLNTVQCTGDTAQPGSLLWVFTAAGAASATITIQGQTFQMTQSGGGGTYKYVSGWYDLNSLIGTVSASYVGDAANPQLTISHGCPPAQLLWCSPGFWAQNQTRLVGSAYDISSYIGQPYSVTNGAPLKTGNPTVVTIGQVLASPQTYGGPAFNSVGNYLSAQFGFGGTQATGESCPIDAFGNLKVAPPLP
jgi:hypothetical protein